MYSYSSVSFLVNMYIKIYYTSSLSSPVSLSLNGLLSDFSPSVLLSEVYC